MNLAQTQAKGLINLMKNGYEVEITKKGEIYAIRRGQKMENRKRNMDKMIKGLKADYSSEYFFAKNGAIYDKSSAKFVDLKRD